jgi:phosphoglycerol transferase MdoB-like AlkP superfamily enzyme
MKRLLLFIQLFIFWTLVGTVSKVVFLVMYHSLFTDTLLTDMFAVLWYGLCLDVAIAGYLTIIPALLLIISLWRSPILLRWLWNIYTIIIAGLASLAYCANIGLYGFWGFPLDNTPLLYIRTSPTDAMASLLWWQLLLAVLAIAVVALAIIKLHPLWQLGKQNGLSVQQRLLQSVLLLLMTAALILPIRGGVGTGTNHTGSVYFSENSRLNHAAVNPIFCFIESLLHQEEIGTKYRFMNDREASELFQAMTYTKLRKDSLQFTNRPNIILISLESFSDSLMHYKNVTPNLRKSANEGMYFTNFYTNSFRTDRALVSIHSGLPAQPSMSIMDIPKKSTSLPSIAGSLSKRGYRTVFYYGGDINYSNMCSYFMGTGFQEIVSEADFPRKQRTGKWGVADGPVYERMLDDIKNSTDDRPFFMSIMTESSHEPFDVPNYKRFADDEVLNAFSYADDCLGKFIAKLRELQKWKNTMVVIVADHLGCFPDNADNYALWRYKSPFIILGGDIRPMQYTAYGSQIDIAATLLGLLNIDHSEFTYSKDLLDADAPHFAYFTFPDLMGMVTDSNSVVYDNTSERIYAAEGADTPRLLEKAKAYLQKLYDDIDKR